MDIDQIDHCLILGRPQAFFLRGNVNFWRAKFNIVSTGTIEGAENKIKLLKVSIF